MTDDDPRTVADAKAVLAAAIHWRDVFSWPTASQDAPEYVEATDDLKAAVDAYLKGTRRD